MVSRPGRSWRWTWRLNLAMLGVAAASLTACGGEAPTIRAEVLPAPVEDALRQGKYPWYDARSEAVKPLWPPREWDLEWLERWLRRLRLGWLPASGKLITSALAAAGLAVLLGMLVLLWRRHQPVPDARQTEARRPGTATRVESLPEGLRPETDDPWSEAQRCRARGDLARAVVCLFAHQLLTLERLRQVRLVPGRTARQLVRAIADRQLQGWVDPTLGLFEAVYYGHRTPTVESFEPVWTAAEAFERRIAEGGVP